MLRLRGVILVIPRKGLVDRGDSSYSLRDRVILEMLPGVLSDVRGVEYVADLYRILLEEERKMLRWL